MPRRGRNTEVGKDVAPSNIAPHLAGVGEGVGLGLRPGRTPPGEDGEVGGGGHRASLRRGGDGAAAEVGEGSALDWKLPWRVVEGGDRYFDGGSRRVDDDERMWME